MIVEVACLFQFLDPCIHALKARLTTLGGLQAIPCIGIGIPFPSQGLKILQIVEPDLRSHFQPTFPVSSPADFLQELLGRLVGVALENGAGDLLLGEEAGADIGSKPGHNTGHVVAKLGIIPSRQGKKLLETL
jgi:hypothetical protein